jgi:hypothetical protein
MHGVAQVVQQLANDLSLVFLLDPAEGGGIGRETGRRGDSLQFVFSFVAPRGGTISRPGEFPGSLKKLPAAGPRKTGHAAGKKAGSVRYMRLLRRHKHLLCSAACPPVLLISY